MTHAHTVRAKIKIYNIEYILRHQFNRPQSKKLTNIVNDNMLVLSLRKRGVIRGPSRAKKTTTTP